MPELRLECLFIGRQLSHAPQEFGCILCETAPHNQRVGIGCEPPAIEQPLHRNPGAPEARSQEAVADCRHGVGIVALLNDFRQGRLRLDVWPERHRQRVRTTEHRVALAGLLAWLTLLGSRL